MKKGSVKQVFPGGNTCEGFHSYYYGCLEGLEKVFVMKGGPGCGKSTLMRKIGQSMVDRGYDVELWQCSSDNDSLDGVLIPALKTAIVDGTAPHVVEPMYPGIVGELVHIGAFWDSSLLMDSKQQIKELYDQIARLFKTAYSSFAEAETAFVKNEEALQQKIKEEEIAAFAEQIVQKIFMAAGPKERHLFAAAFTPRGPVDYQDLITDTCSWRYILKGGNRSLKSFLIDQIAQTARERGHSMDIYHHPLNPNALSFLLLPSLGVAVFDGDLYQVNEKRPGDQEIDLKNCFYPFSAAEEKDCQMNTEQFKNRLASGIEQIAKAKEKHDQLETYYVRAMDFEAVDAVGQELFNKILAIASGEKEKK